MRRLDAHASGLAGDAVTLDPRLRRPLEDVGAAAGRYVRYSTVSASRPASVSRGTSVDVRRGAQISLGGWYPDYPTPGGFITPTRPCTSIATVANVSNFCDRTIDRQIARAQLLGGSDPQAAYRLWATVDRELTDQSPWVSFANGDIFELKISPGRELPTEPAMGSAARPDLAPLSRGGQPTLIASLPRTRSVASTW